MTRALVLPVVVLAACTSPRAQPAQPAVSATAPATEPAADPEAEAEVAARLLAHEPQTGNYEHQYHVGFDEAARPELTRQWRTLVPALMEIAVAGPTLTAPAGELIELGFVGTLPGHEFVLFGQDLGAHRVEVLFEVGDAGIAPVVAAVFEPRDIQPSPPAVFNQTQACIQYTTTSTVGRLACASIPR